MRHQTRHTAMSRSMEDYLAVETNRPVSPRIRTVRVPLQRMWGEHINRAIPDQDHE